MPSLTTVKARMKKVPVTLKPDMHVYDAVSILLKHSISVGFVINDEGELVGVLAERDCLDAFMNEKYYESPAALVRDLMSSKVVSIHPDTDILQAADLFSQHKFHHLPVVLARRLVGDITRRDVIRAIIETRQA